MRTIERIRARFDDVVSDLARLAQELPIEYFETHGYGIAIFAPNYNFGERSPEQKNRQLQIKRSYDAVFELIRVLLGHAPEQLVREFENADKGFRIWLEFASNWAVREDKKSNDAELRQAAKSIDALLDVLSSSSAGQTIIIPDTNSLLWHPDPESYRISEPQLKFDFVLLPTVLGELDQLKVLHRNPDVRDKAAKVIRRIKGWQGQGTLLDGIIVAKNISVRAEYREPDMSTTLSWLDGENNDDRIVACVLAVQAAFPNARVLLATGDINLQNKADAAMIEIMEVDDDVPISA